MVEPLILYGNQDAVKEVPIALIIILEVMILCTQRAKLEAPIHFMFSTIRRGGKAMLLKYHPPVWKLWIAALLLTLGLQHNLPKTFQRMESPF